MTYLIIIAALIAAYVIFGRGRKTALAERAILNDSEKALLAQHIDYYDRLSAEEKMQFIAKIEQFLTNVRIEGVGLEVNDTDRLMVASSAVIPIFKFKDWTYRNATNVLLYPDTFDKDYQFEGSNERNIMGMVGSGYMNGQMILSRAALQKGFSRNNGKENTGIHEFVHLLDKSDGATDGIPKGFLPHEYIRPWVQMMHKEISRIEAGHSDINPYAATNEAEFFAVISEYFFEKSALFREKHPELYELLSKTFGQDPAK